jgi:hypothetical protein
MKNQTYIIFMALMGMGFLGFLAISGLDGAKKSEEKLQRIIDSKELREFTFYRHRDGNVVMEKKIYITSKKEEAKLLSYLIKHEETCGDSAFFLVDSISMATLDTASIGRNFPCKMIVMKWNEKIIWKR